MFYCDPCRRGMNWPEGFSKSRGRCESCGADKVECYDVKSSLLPTMTLATRSVSPLLRLHGEVRAEVATRLLMSLTDDERKDVFGLFCRHCGRIQPDDGKGCQCWNDE